MSPQCDPNVSEDACERITLAGEPYLVAPLPLRQVMAIRPLLGKAHAAIIAPAEAWTEGDFLPVAQIVWRGLKRAYPSLTLDEFLDMPATVAEMISALPVVLRQAGARNIEQGEAKAAS
jgi:hypothetical protein